MNARRLPAWCPVCARAIGWEDLFETDADGVVRALGRASTCEGCGLDMEMPNRVPVYEPEPDTDSGQPELWT